MLSLSIAGSCEDKDLSTYCVKQGWTVEYVRIRVNGDISEAEQVVSQVATAPTDAAFEHHKQSSFGRFSCQHKRVCYLYNGVEDSQAKQQLVEVALGKAAVKEAGAGEGVRKVGA